MRGFITLLHRYAPEAAALAEEPRELAHDARIVALAHAAESGLLLAVSEDDALTLWDTSTGGRLLWRLRGSTLCVGKRRGRGFWKFCRRSGGAEVARKPPEVQGAGRPEVRCEMGVPDPPLDSDVVELAQPWMPRKHSPTTKGSEAWVIWIICYLGGGASMSRGSCPVPAGRCIDSSSASIALFVERVPPRRAA